MKWRWPWSKIELPPEDEPPEADAPDLSEYRSGSGNTDTVSSPGKTTAMLDEVLAQIRAESNERTQEVQQAARRAGNASRRIVGRTGMNLQKVALPSKVDKPS